MYLIESGIPMKREHFTVRNHKIPMGGIRRNLRISSIRSMVEHLYAFMKRMFGFSHTMVTTVKRARVKTYFIPIS